MSDLKENLARVNDSFTRIHGHNKVDKHMEIMNAAIASTINAVAITDVEGNLRYVNHSFLEMWAYKNDKEILGRPVVRCWKTENKAAKVVEVLHNRGNWIGEMTAIRKNGSIFDVQISASSVIDGNGELVCMIYSFVDIKARKRLLQLIQQNDKRYKTLVESLDETIAIINEEGVFLFINGMGAKRLGGKSEDFIGKTMWDLFPQKVADQQANDVREVINTGKEKNVVALIEMQGRPRWYIISIVPLRDCDGKVTTVMVIARDIHAYKQAEEELNKYFEKMSRVEQLASAGTLSATLVHELTRPITVIRLSIQNSLADLKAIACPDSVIEDLKEGLNEIAHITSIVDKFRDFTRKTSKKAMEKVDLKAIAERMIELFDEEARRAKCVIQLKGLDLLPSIYFHKKDLEQIFFSLAENAIQAADGKKSHKLIISGAFKNDRLELWFSDDCDGIAPDNINKIFQPFFTTKHAGGGTGLGLCVVERILSQHRGKIHVKSTFGKGSTFFVTLRVTEKKE
jgi:two-component system sporulation sensor kinase A